MKTEDLIREPVDPFQQGRLATSIFDNPYWPEYPNKCANGEAEEIAARKWVDGYFSK